MQYSADSEFIILNLSWQICSKEEEGNQSC